MEETTYTALAERLKSEDEKVHVVELLDAEIAELTREQAERLVARYGSTTIMRLPGKERAFFDWLKREDPAIWTDLWGDDDQDYTVSLSFLPELLPNRRGFMICDLLDNPNYYFTPDDITPEEGRGFSDAALEIVKANRPLTLDQAFVVEVWRAPIDQWRFSYNYDVPLSETKRIVQWLLEEGILIHNRAGRREPEQTEAQ